MCVRIVYSLCTVYTHFSVITYIYTIFTTTTAAQDAAIAFCYKTLNSLGMTGRLRIAREVRESLIL